MVIVPGPSSFVKKLRNLESSVFVPPHSCPPIGKQFLGGLRTQFCYLQRVGEAVGGD